MKKNGNKKNIKKKKKKKKKKRVWLPELIPKSIVGSKIQFRATKIKNNSIRALKE